MRPESYCGNIQRGQMTLAQIALFLNLTKIFCIQHSVHICKIQSAENPIDKAMTNVDCVIELLLRDNSIIVQF